MSEVKRYECLLIEDAPRLQAILPQGAVVCSERTQMMVTAEDYAMLEAEAQALREEVMRERQDKEQALYALGQSEDANAALRARVVVIPDRAQHDAADSEHSDGCVRGFNDCLDELARLNGKSVSEGLLRETVRSVDDIFWAIHAKPSCQSGVVARCRCRLCAGTRLAMARDDLNALLGEGKEHE